MAEIFQSAGDAAGAIGNLIVRLRLDTEGFTRKTAASRATLKQFQNTAKEVASLRNMEALMNGNTRAFGQLQHATKNATGALNRYNGITKQVKAGNVGLVQTSRQAGRGFTMMRSSMAQLSVIALGSRSALSQLGQGMLFSFGFGSAAMVAITGGILAVVTAFKFLTREARKAKEETKKLLESLRSGAQADFFRTTPEAKFGPLRADAERRRDEVLRRVQTSRGFSPTGAAGDFRISEKDTKALSKALSDLFLIGEAVESASKGVENSLERQRLLLTEGAEAAFRFDLKLKGLNQTQIEARVAQRQINVDLEAGIQADEDRAAAIERAGKAMAAQRDALDKSAAAWERYKIAARESILQGLLTPMQALKQELARIEVLFEGDPMLGEIRRKTIQAFMGKRKSGKGAKADNEFLEVGRSTALLFSQGFVQGILTQAQSIADVLKNTVLSALESIIAIFIERLIASIAAAKLAAFIASGGVSSILEGVGAALGSLGGGIGLGISAPSAGALVRSRGGLDFSELNAHPSPQVQARDRQWIKLYRATGLEVARQGG